MRKHGFTLLELLVVIAVIGVLIAITMPAIKGARDRANTVACAANLHGIGEALHEYLDENARFLPVAAYAPLENSVTPPIYPPLYLAMATQLPMLNATQPAKIWYCPSDNQTYYNEFTNQFYPSVKAGQGLSYYYIAAYYGWRGKKIDTGYFYSLLGISLTPLIQDFLSFHGPTGARVSKNVVYLDGHVSTLDDYSPLLTPTTAPSF